MPPKADTWLQIKLTGWVPNKPNRCPLGSNAVGLGITTVLGFGVSGVGGGCGGVDGGGDDGGGEGGGVLPPVVVLRVAVLPAWSVATNLYPFSELCGKVKL